MGWASWINAPVEMQCFFLKLQKFSQIERGTLLPEQWSRLAGVDPLRQAILSGRHQSALKRRQPGLACRSSGARSRSSTTWRSWARWGQSS